MNVKLLTLLKEYGLSGNEINIYLSIVEKKELTAYKIAKETGVHRSTTYDILKKLIRKGFISKLEKNNKSKYTANDTSAIIAGLKGKESILLAMVPELSKLERKNETNIKFLEGLDGRKQFNYNLFSTVKERKVNEVYIIGNTEAQFISIKLFVDKLLKEAATFKKQYPDAIYLGIWSESFKNSEIVKEFKKIGQNKFIKNIPSKVTMIIYGDNVAYLINTPEQHTIEIKSREVAEENIAYFKHLWKIARK